MGKRIIYNASNPWETGKPFDTKDLRGSLGLNEELLRE
jgi:hypothetical protein